MPYVQRDKGKIVGVFAGPQPFASEHMDANAAELVAWIAARDLADAKISALARLQRAAISAMVAADPQYAAAAAKVASAKTCAECEAVKL